MSNYKFPLLLLLLGTASPGWAQSRQVLERENLALKQEKAALLATQSANIESVAVGPAGEQVKVHFVSCLANRKTKQAALSLLLDNQPYSCLISLKGFPALTPTLKKLQVNFLLATQSGQAAQPFTTALQELPVVWEAD